MRVIKESIWQELADITDKRSSNGAKCSRTLSHHGVYHSGEVVGSGNLVCEKCHFHLAVYTPDCCRCARNVETNKFSADRSNRNSLISHSNKENMGRMKFPGPCFYFYSKASVSRIS
ncbi:zinc ribbon-containing protein [Shigella flexneri]